MALLNQANAVMVGSAAASRVYRGGTQVWPPAATVAPSRPTGSNATHTSCRISWTTVSGITEYELKHQSHNYGVVTGTSKDITGLLENSTYDFQIRTVRRYGSTGVVYSDWSPILRLTTGRPEARKTGSLAIELRPTKTGTYRPVDAWAYNGNDVAQGYYSASDHTAFGVITFDGAGFRNWVSSTYGSDVVGNLNYTVARVAMYRTATSGNQAVVDLNWHLTGSVAHSGGQPAIAGGVQAGALGYGQSAYIDLPFPHWAKHVLHNEDLGGYSGVYVVNSFCLYYAGTAGYARFLGMHGASNACNLYVEANWDFVTQTYIAPAWSNV